MSELVQIKIITTITTTTQNINRAPLDWDTILAWAKKKIGAQPATPINPFRSIFWTSVVIDVHSIPYTNLPTFGTTYTR
jgi:hypothetical protein